VLPQTLGPLRPRLANRSPSATMAHALGSRVEIKLVRRKGSKAVARGAQRKR
jgi:hypothetical protein